MPEALYPFDGPSQCIGVLNPSEPEGHTYVPEANSGVKLICAFRGHPAACIASLISSLFGTVLPSTKNSHTCIPAIEITVYGRNWL